MPAMSRGRLIRRGAYLAASVAPAWAAITVMLDGVRVSLGALNLSSTEPVRPLLIGLAAAAYYASRASRAEADADGEWAMTLLRRAIPITLAAVIATTAIVGIRYGTFVAGSADSYGYLSQARLWAAGRLRVEQPWVSEMSWPEREWTFTPLGYRPIQGTDIIVPTYAAGLPIVMAGFERTFGANGPFYVVPILGALAVWLTYALGREAVRSPTAGIIAAALLAASPVFLAHSLLPMTDVPVTAGWTLVWLLSFQDRAGSTRPRPLAAGMAAGATLLIRPNLAPLVLVPLAAWGWPSLLQRAPWREVLRNAALFGAALAPGVLTVAALNRYWYGSPLASGYGTINELYSLSAAGVNLRNYGSWLVQSQTVLVLLALLPWVMPLALRRDETRASVRVGCAAVVALVAMSYLFYAPFDHWFYLRFLLPGFPILFVLMAAGIRGLSLRLPRVLRVAAACLLLAVCVASGLMFARDQEIYSQRDVERRYPDAARAVAEQTQSNAVILAVQHSGSVRYYAQRITLRYDWLAPDRLDGVLEELSARGYHPYILLEDWEEPEFRARFASANRAGRIDWDPIAEIPGRIRVRLYDPIGRTARNAP